MACAVITLSYKFCVPDTVKYTIYLNILVNIFKRRITTLENPNLTQKCKKLFVTGDCVSVTIMINIEQ